MLYTRELRVNRDRLQLAKSGLAHKVILSDAQTSTFPNMDQILCFHQKLRALDAISNRGVKELGANFLAKRKQTVVG